MSKRYNPGETATIYLQVLRLSGSAPVFPSDYTAPQVRVMHVDSGLVIDVPATAMTQLDDNLWYFNHAIPPTPFVGDYLVEFTTTIDGIATEANDEFRVELSDTDINEEGNGSCEISDVVKDSGTLQPIGGCTVLAFATTDLVNAIAKSVTDSNGVFTVYLNPGSYKLRFHKVGWIDETHDLTVENDCMFDIDGD